MAKDFNKQLREKMNSIVGCSNVFAEYEKRYCYSFDATNISDGVKICDIVVFRKYQSSFGNYEIRL